MEQFLNEQGTGIYAFMAIKALIEKFKIDKQTATKVYKIWRRKYVRTTTSLKSDQPRNKVQMNRYTNEQRLEMLKMKESGLSCEKIGKKYGVSRECIYYQLVRAREIRKAGNENE